MSLYVSTPLLPGTPTAALATPEIAIGGLSILQSKSIRGASRNLRCSVMIDSIPPPLPGFKSELYTLQRLTLVSGAFR